MKKKNVRSVVENNLCIGCGACEAVNNYNCIKINEGKSFNYPEIVKECRDCGLCLKVCPGINISNAMGKQSNSKIGTYKTISITHSLDKEIRYNASSGGLVTQILLYLIESKAVDRVIITKKSESNPLKNESIICRNQKEILSGMGSRYSPSSSCVPLKKVINDQANLKYAFVGKGCDIEGLEKLKKIHPSLSKKILYSIGIFCDHTPSYKAIESLFEKLGIDHNEVKEIDYRGLGWPGFTRITLKNNSIIKLPYDEAWKTLKRPNFTNFRCFLCPDGLAELADISVGDPWFKKNDSNNAGESLVIARTKQGNELMQQLVKNGKITAKSSCQLEVINSQKNIISKKTNLLARVRLLKLLGIKCPSYSGDWNFEILQKERGIKSLLKSASDKNFIYIVLSRIFGLRKK